MILNTTNNGFDGENPPVLYAPIDPKYIYPGKENPVSTAYFSDPLSPEDNYQSAGNGLDSLMSQRREIVHSRIQMLVSEIYQRHKLQDENLYKICRDQCDCRNLIFDIGDHIWDNKRMELERKIIDLEKEKRMEQTSYFRDILFLKKEFREALIEELEDRQKADLFMNSGEVLT